MKDKRVYIINRMQLVETGLPVGAVHMPWLAGITELLEPYTNEDDDHWDVIYSKDMTEGISSQAVVGVYTSEENHAILESDPDIERIDDI